MFVLPMPQSKVGGFAAVVSWLRNWSMWEVFALTLVGNRLSMSLLGQFLLGDACTLIDQTLRDKFADLVPDGLCYGMQAEMLPGSWMIIASAVLLVIVSGLLVSLGRAAAEKRKLHRWMRPFVVPYYVSDEEREPHSGGIQ